MTDFDRIYDVGVHAAQEALATLIRVTETLPTSNERNGAMALALGYVMHKADGLTVASKRAYPAFGKTMNGIRELLNSEHDINDHLEQFAAERGLEIPDRG